MRRAALSLAALLVAACSAAPGSSGSGGAGGGASGWTQLTPAPAALTGVSLLDVAANGAGFVAVGNAPETNGIQYGGAFTSADGSSWTAAPNEPFKSATAGVVGSTSKGLVTLGDSCSGECGGFLSWLSADGGATWAGPGKPPSLQQSRPVGVVERGSTVVAVANELVDPANNHYRGWLLLSTDGTTWAEAPHPELFDNIGFGGVASDGSNVVAVGSRILPSGLRDGAAWTSKDGSSWTVATDDGSFKGAILQTVVHGTSGYVAVGQIGTDGAVWTSSDGASWTRADGGAFKASPLLDVAVGASGYVAIGRDPSGGAVWTSADGKTWKHLGPIPGMEDTKLLAVAIGQSRTIIVGQVLGGSAGSSLIWLGPLP